MQRLKLKHPLSLRWFHWINFPLLAIMIWSGLLIYWAYSPYNLLGFHFFPKSFYTALNIPQRLAEGMALHFFFMWLFIGNGVAYVAWTLLSGEWRLLVPTSPKAFSDAGRVALHDLGFHTPLPTQDKYNAAQQISYTAIIVMGAGSFLTGLAIYKPMQLAWLTALCGGYTLARLLHFSLTIGYVLFFIVHILQVLRAGWNNFRGMVSGYEVVGTTIEEGPVGE